MARLHEKGGKHTPSTYLCLFGFGSVRQLYMSLSTREAEIQMRVTPDLHLEIDQLAIACGYSRSKTMRKLIEGALRRIQGGTPDELRLALNRWSKLS